jgi:hypothetical protein
MIPETTGDSRRLGRMPALWENRRGGGGWFGRGGWIGSGLSNLASDNRYDAKAMQYGKGRIGGNLSICDLEPGGQQ